MKSQLLSSLVIIGILLINYNCKPKNNSTKMIFIDTTNFDQSVQPGFDFYQYANGGWMEKNPLPKEESRYGTFDKLREDNNKQMKDLVSELNNIKHEEGSIAQKVNDYFTIALDSSANEKLGYTPILNYLDDIQKIKDKKDIEMLLSKFQKIGIRTIFIVYATPDKKNSSMNITGFYQSGLGLPDVDYYKADDDRSKEIRVKYEEHIVRMFELCNYSSEEAKTIAKNCMNFETRLAYASMTRLENRDPEKTYNKMPLEDIQKLSPNINWKVYLDNINLNDPGEINVSQPVFFKEISNMFDEEPIAIWKQYLSWKTINHAAPYLSSDFVNANFDFYGKLLSGQEEIKPRWKRVFETSNNTLGEAIGKLYVEKYFPQESKERMLALVNNLKDAFAQRIDNLEWMGDSTKTKAREKLEAFRVKIGYPDEWRNYDDLKVGRESYYANILSTNKFNFDFEMNKIGKPVDPNEWHMAPQVVNAYYNPTQNEIVFPAGILQPPFFFAKGDDAINYGAIGVVIGHEMTHGFDDMGRKFDKDGNLNNWWTDSDYEKFNERSQILVDQFNSFMITDGVHADGKLTLGENIADFGGLNIAYTALMNTLSSNSKQEMIEGFTLPQRFFLAYAHLWAQNIREEEALKLTKIDVHSIGRFRVNGPLRNIPEFYEAFGVTSEMALYLPEEERAVIW